VAFSPRGTSLTGWQRFRRNIVAQSQRRKEEAALNILPATPVNGHAADISFSAAQAQKEMWTARLRELEYLERKAVLIPTSYVKFWGANFILAIKDEMLKASELRDVLASESDPTKVQGILDGWVSRVCDRIHQLESLWAQAPGVM
jgi:hypothetical protein